MPSNTLTPNRGFTLIELMIAIAVLALVASIAVPWYQGYIREARLGVAKSNMEGLRIYLEDFRIDNNDYRAGGNTTLDKGDLESILGWTPDGDQDQYNYRVTATTTSFDVLAEWATDTSTWVFCEDRMSNCCDNTTTGASKTNCP